MAKKEGDDIFGLNKKSKGPKTPKGEMNKMLTGNGRKNPETAIAEDLRLNKNQKKKKSKKI